MPGWESLRLDLLRYREQAPRALVVWPSPDTERRRERPALIGTASLVPDLGHAVPPGRWGLVVSLQTETSGHLLSEPLELTVEP
ncbi:hypothetical protein [Kribbella karoonensis]|uniref:Uncharacterized protein n=1 Tax=Kribbella karoonensis TaxID=324851 RepID=A0ABN2EES2_9ACTN